MKKIQISKLFSKNTKNAILISIVAILIAALLGYGYIRNSATTIDYTFYEMLLENNFIKEAEIRDDYLILKTNEERYKIAKDGVEIKELLKKTPVDIKTKNNIFTEILDFLLILFFLIFGYAVLKTFKKPNIAQKEEPKREPKQKEDRSFSTSLPGIDENQNRITPIKSTVLFSDVAGIKEVKDELEEIIDFLKNPIKYKSFGVRLPKGVLLIGPPGVGKTLIAKAVAGEADVPFFYQSGSSFVQIYVGMGAKRVRELFLRAKSMSPSIVFIDEIDAVGKARGGFRNDERESTLNQLLTEMDGFEDSEGVIVIAATNKIDMLDEALLRSGRFDRRIFVGLPTLNERVDIFKVYLKNKKHNIDLIKLSKMCVGFSGAAIASLVNEAAIVALRRGSEILEIEDFLDVKDEVLLGKKKKLSFSEDEKRVLATYQAAKAISAFWFEIDFEKFSLVNDGLKEIDKEIVSKSEMFSKIKVYLAGMAAMELVYNESFTNNQEDLFKAKIIATDMAEKFGMGNSLIPTSVDVVTILNEALEEMKRFLGGLKETLKRVENRLLENESITKYEIKECLDELL